MSGKYGSPAPGASYNGFSAAAPQGERPARTPPRPLIIGGMATAVVSGLVLGLVMRPGAGPREPQSEAAAEAAVRQPLPIEVTPPPPIVPPAGKLAVLPRPPPRAAPQGAARLDAPARSNVDEAEPQERTAAPEPPRETTLDEQLGPDDDPPEPAPNA